MAAQPQDHKTKSKDHLTVKVRDAKLRIPLEALDDFELLEDLSEAQSLAGKDDDPEAAGRAAQLALTTLKRLLPPSEMEKAKNTLRSPETGRVKASDMLSLVEEIFEAANNPNS